MTQTKSKRDYEQDITLKFGVKDTLSEDGKRSLHAALLTRLEPDQITISNSDSPKYLQDVEQGYKEIQVPSYMVTDLHGVTREYNDSDMNQNVVDLLIESGLQVEAIETPVQDAVESWPHHQTVRILNTGINRKLGIPLSELQPYFWSEQQLNSEKDDYARPYMVRYFVFRNEVGKVEFNGGLANWTHDGDSITELRITFNLEASTPEAFKANEVNINKFIDHYAQAFLGTNMFSTKAVSCAGSINATVPVSCEAISANDLPSFEESGR